VSRNILLLLDSSIRVVAAITAALEVINDAGLLVVNDAGLIVVLG
jgi:hypothetical protein